MQDRVYKRAKWAHIGLNLHDHLQTFTLKIPRANTFDKAGRISVDSHDLILITPVITTSPVFTKHCLGST